MMPNSLTPDILVKFETYKKDIFEDLKYYKQVDTLLILEDISLILRVAKEDLPEDKFNELCRFVNSLFKDLGSGIRLE